MIMEVVKEKTIALFFTRGISLVFWDKKGLLDREIELYKKLADHVKTIYLFSYGASSEKEYQKLFPNNVVIVPKVSGIPFFLYSFLIPFIHRKLFRTVDVLKTNQMDGSWAAVIAKKVYKKKLVVRCGYEWLFTLRQKKSLFLKRWFAWCVEYIAYKNADRIVMTALPAVHFVQQEFGIKEEKFVVIPNYVDTELFRPDPSKPKEKKVLFVGRLEEEKNLFMLIDAMRGVDATLVFVGTGSQERALVEHAKKNDVRLELRGSLPHKELVPEMNTASVFVLPSLYEGNPKVLLEAMACGMAVVGTNVSGIKDVISNGKDGVLCNSDISSFKNAIDTLLKNNELRTFLGEGARTEIVEKYSLEKILNQELLVYNSLQ